MSKNTIWVIIIAILLIAGGVYAFTALNGEPADEQVFCTMDARLCPDGSSVGRVPPDCEFAACPSGGETPPGAMMEDGTLNY